MLYTLAGMMKEKISGREEKGGSHNVQREKIREIALRWSPPCGLHWEPPIPQIIAKLPANLLDWLIAVWYVASMNSFLH